ncbi:helix-turn-helix transcriptional regulator [Rhizobium laguerreae]|nr:helix-turn-helix transcriptional regulator [Rhizobium laguerreae]
MVSWNLESINQSFSDGALGEQSWGTALDGLSESIGAVGAVIVPLRGGIPSMPCATRFAEAIEGYHKGGWDKNDVRFRALPALHRKGYGTDLDILSEDEIGRSPYYQEWLRPNGLKWFAGIHIKGFEEEWVLSLQRTEQQGPFTEREGELLVKMSRNFASTAVLANAIGFARADAALEGFTLSGKAIVMLNRMGEVVRTNPAAECLFDHDLCVRNNRLTSSSRTSATKLDQAIRDACNPLQQSFNKPVLLERHSGRPLVAFVSPAKGVIAKDIIAPCQAYVVLVDPYKREAVSARLLREIFGLTPTEAVIAVRLSRGDSLRDISIATGISYETARTHLRAIFAKVGVSDQSDLVAVFLQLNIGF